MNKKVFILLLNLLFCVTLVSAQEAEKSELQQRAEAVNPKEDIAKARNAVLLIRKKDTGEIIFGINLPYILASGRTWVERNYHYQEYLDREYDYRLQFIIRGARIDEIQLILGSEIHIVSWTKRYQNESLG